MQRTTEEIAKTRADTDASLVAERDDSDSASRLKTVEGQRARDDLLNRDRLLADERLWKYRLRTDALQAREGTLSPTLDRLVATERRVADEAKRAERDLTDAHLDRERARSDTVIEKERQSHEGDRAAVAARRHDTDQQLTAERQGVDIAIAKSTSALADVQGAKDRQTDTLGMVAHELRSPLCIIMMSAQLLAEGANEGTTREGAEEVRRAALQMERLLADLIDAARIESGTLRITKADHDVGAFVSNVFRSYRELFASRHIGFTLEGPAAPLVASFDHDRIIQVLSNLLGNALKFTPAHGAVGLCVKQIGSDVEFELKDSGPGIPADALRHVFTRFWQLGSESRRGLGLGLYICENIMLAHHGRIWVESTFGSGAVFRFTLPAHAAEQTQV